MARVTKFPYLGFVLLALLEFFVVFQFTFAPVNTARVSYRRKERGAAMMVLATNKTPETEATYQEERRRVSRYVLFRQSITCGVVFGALLLLSWWLIHLWRQTS